MSKQGDGPSLVYTTWDFTNFLTSDSSPSRLLLMLAMLIDGWVAVCLYQLRTIGMVADC